MTFREPVLFRAIGDALVASGAAHRGTMMGHPCLRTPAGGFFAAAAPSGAVVVKLTRERVDALVAAGVGQPFAPAGRRFREWVALPDTSTWQRHVDEALAVVSAREAAD